MRPSTMPWPSAVSSDPTQNPKIQRGLISVRARMRNSNDTLRNTMPSAITVNGPNSLPSTTPQANGNAETNSPSPSNGQNSLASRQGLSRPIMRPRSSEGASCSSSPTPMSNPSSTMPAAISSSNSPTKTSGIQNEGSSGLRPSEAARVAIMRILRSCARAPRHSARHGTACPRTRPAARRTARHGRPGCRAARAWSPAPALRTASRRD